MLVSLPQGQWTLVTTTTRDTAFQNKTLRETFIRTESASGDLRDGYNLGYNQGIVIQSGTAVYASALDGDGTIFLMGV